MERLLSAQHNWSAGPHESARFRCFNVLPPLRARATEIPHGPTAGRPFRPLMTVRTRRQVMPITRHSVTSSEPFES